MWSFSENGKLKDTFALGRQSIFKALKPLSCTFSNGTLLFLLFLSQLHLPLHIQKQSTGAQPTGRPSIWPGMASPAVGSGIENLPSLSCTRELQEAGRGRHVAGRPCAAAAQSAATEQ